MDAEETGPAVCGELVSDPDEPRWVSEEGVDMGAETGEPSGISGRKGSRVISMDGEWSWGFHQRKGEARVGPPRVYPRYTHDPIGISPWAVRWSRSGGGPRRRTGAPWSWCGH